MERGGIKERTLIGLFEIVCLITIIITFSSVLLLALNIFNPFLAAGLSIMTLLALLIKHRSSFAIKKIMTKTNIILFFILLLALVFRHSPYMYLYADVHDQAHYVIMSETYAHTGSPFIDDPVAEKITDPLLQKYYEERNVKLASYDNMPSHSRNWGVHVQKDKRFAYEFRFYPVQPLWMAIFSRFFGDTERVYALVFFSLISIAAFFLLALELSSGKLGAATLTGIIFALNDQHAFFSKTPVSEIVYLAFISSGLYFLLKYYKDSNELKQNDLHLFLSAGLLGCSFFTRITAYVYVSFFYALLAIAILYLPKNRIKKNLLTYFISLFALYTLSLIYGKYYSHIYFKEHIQDAFLRHFLGPHWNILWPFALAASIAILFIVAYANAKNFIIVQRVKEILARNRAQLLLVAFCFIIIYSFDKANQINTLGENLHRYLPFSFAIIFFPALFISARKNFESFALCTLLAILSFALLPTEAFYDQNYSRYILDLLSFTFLLCSIFIWDLISASRYSIIKFIVVVAAILVLMQSSYYLAQQGAIKHTNGIHDALVPFVQPIKEKDLLIFDQQYSTQYWELKNVLDYYFHLNVFGVERIEHINERLGQYIRQYDSVFVFSQRPYNFTFITAPYTKENTTLELVSETHFVQTTFNKTQERPEIIDLPLSLYLYRLQEHL